MGGSAKLFDQIAEFLEPAANAKHLALQIGGRWSRAVAPPQFCDDSMFQIAKGRFHFKQRPMRLLPWLQSIRRVFTEIGIVWVCLMNG